MLEFSKESLQTREVWGILYVLVDTDYAAAHLLQRH